MQIVILCLLALATSLDSLGVGVAYGLSGTRVRVSAHGCIAAVMLIITWSAVYAGNHVSRYLPELVTHLLSATFFVVVGIWMIVPIIRKKRSEQQRGEPGVPGSPPTLREVLNDPRLADRDSSRDIDMREALLLGVALSLNNIGGGVSAGMIQITPASMALLSVFFNVVCLNTGHLMGARLNGTRLSAHAQVLSGALMILVGLWQLH